MKGRKFIALMTAASLLTPVAAGIVNPTSAFASLPVLKLGDQGTYVTTLQKALNDKGYSCGTPDGMFGNATAAAVRKFQLAQHLPADGVVGSATWTALGVKDTSLASGGTSGGSTCSSSSPSQRNLKQTEIWLNGKLVSSPMAFAWNNTTYMPIWYVQHALESLHIGSTWDGTHWNLILPQGMTADFQNPPMNIGTGKLQIEINGTLVKCVDAIVYQDPATGYKTNTTYMPIWYVMGVLQRIGVTQPHPWDGAHWYMATKNGLFTAYKTDGTKLQDYATLADAEAAVSNVPGAYVKDGSGTVVYQVPDYRAFVSPTKIVGDFTSVQTAAAALQASNGYVINVKTNTVAQYPEDYYYLNNDKQWTSKKSGPTGTAAPSFAKSGETYYVVTGSTTQYYLLTTADNQYSGKLMNPNPSENPLQNVDLRFPAPSSVTPAQIDNWLSQHQSPLTGLGASFVSAQNKYGVDATYLVSHAVLETYWGTSQIYKAKNNLYGWGAYDSNPGNYAGSFPSSDYAIQFEAYIVRQMYLEPGGTFYVSPTLDGMQKHYASDTSWANSIARIMNQYVSENNGTVSAYPQFPQSSLPPVSLVSDEPVYRMNRASAKVLSNPCGNLPVFSDPGTGASQMFPGTLKYGSIGSAVKQLQKALGVTADGVFGPMTQSALTAYQRNHPGLSASGVCDGATWVSLFPPPKMLPVGTQVVVDAMKQGMVANTVTEWCHVTGNGISGWVDENDLAFTNVYRVQVSGGYNANVYAAESRSSSRVGTVHVGDYIVTNTPFPDGTGFIPILWVNQQTGQAMTAYLDGSVAQLSKLPAPSTN